MTIDVSYWISPQKLELPQLSPCDPTILALNKVSVGAMTIDPEHPFEFDIPHDVDYDPATDYIVLEMKCSWGLSTVETTALCEFVGLAGTTETEEPLPGSAVSRLALAASPNPTRGPSTLHFMLPEATRVSIAVFDAQGRMVRALLEGENRNAGEYQVRWDGKDAGGRDVPSGVYYTRLTAGEQHLSRSVLVTR